MYQQAITTAGTDAYPFFFRLANNIAAKIDAAAKAIEAKINEYRIIFSTIVSPCHYHQFIFLFLWKV